MAEKADKQGRVRVYVRLPEAMADWLQSEADARVVARDLLVEKALNDYRAFLSTDKPIDDLKGGKP